MNIIRLDEALLHLNRMRALNQQAKIPQGVIASQVFPDIPPTTAAQYFSLLKKGKRMNALEPQHIVRICELTGVSSDYLLGISSTIGGTVEV